jgi:hypothetical protein
MSLDLTNGAGRIGVEKMAAVRARHDAPPVARFVDAGEVGGCGSTADDVRERAWALTALWWIVSILSIALGLWLIFKK